MYSSNSDFINFVNHYLVGVLAIVIENFLNKLCKGRIMNAKEEEEDSDEYNDKEKKDDDDYNDDTKDEEDEDNKDKDEEDEGDEE